jgi:hypothetical protein
MNIYTMALTTLATKALQHCQNKVQIKKVARKQPMILNHCNTLKTGIGEIQ